MRHHSDRAGKDIEKSKRLYIFGSIRNFWGFIVEKICSFPYQLCCSASHCYQWLQGKRKISLLAMTMVHSFRGILLLIIRFACYTFINDLQAVQIVNH